MDTKGLTIETPSFKQSEQKDIGKLGSYAEIEVPDGTTSIPIVVAPTTSNKRFVSFGLEGTSSENQNTQTTELTTSKSFTVPPVPVQWTGRIPRTRQEPKDNFRIVQINRNGGLDQVEIGIATRGHRFFLTAQLQFRGLVVPNGSAPTIAPSQEQFSYPGFAGYDNQWPGVLPNIQRWMTTWEVKPEGRRPNMYWNPGQNPFGEQGAAVLFFSPVGGTGRLLTAKGVAHFLSAGELLTAEVLFLHFTGINPGVNDQLGVEPMTWVKVEEIKPPRQGGGLKQATRVAIN
jgi:hypothetical protein